MASNTQLNPAGQPGFAPPAVESSRAPLMLVAAEEENAQYFCMLSHSPEIRPEEMHVLHPVFSESNAQPPPATARTFQPPNPP
jgi:hypothetical protein